jgi:AdoMet-dependent heme synthase
MPLLAPHVPTDHRPYHVQIEVTWRCNWRCVHCYQDDHELEVLTLADLERLFDDLVACGTMHVILTGGEPLIRPDLVDIARAARRRGLGITLYTNAHAVTDALAAELARSIAVAEVSILAGTAELHDALSRVKGSHLRAWAGIDRMRAAGIDVIVKTPILAPAYGSLRELEAEVHRRGLTWNPDPEISASYAGADFPLAYRIDAADLERFYREFPRYDPGRAQLRRDPGAPGGVCLAGRQYAFVDAAGNVYPCLNFKAACDARVAHGEVPRALLGNVRTAAFATLWRDAPILGEIRAASRATFARCAACADTCQPCMAASYEEHGALFAPARTICETGQIVARAGGRRIVRLPLLPA